MKFQYEKKYYHDPDKAKVETVITEFDLVEKKDSYIVNGSIREWEAEKKEGKNIRCVAIDLDKPLTITGDVVINGYLTSRKNVFVKGVYKVGDKYAAPK